MEILTSTLGSTQTLEAAGEFYLSDDIDMDVVTRLAQAILQKVQDSKALEKKPDIILNIGSYGGGVDATLYLGAVLRRAVAAGHAVVTRVQGAACSGAFVLAQFGTRRLMDAFARAHMHTVQVGIGYKPDVVVFEDLAAANKRMRETLAGIFAVRNTAGHTTAEYWLTFFDGREHYFTAAEALERGLVDEIVGGF